MKVGHAPTFVDRMSSFPPSFLHSPGAVRRHDFTEHVGAAHCALLPETRQQIQERRLTGRSWILRPTGWFPRAVDLCTADYWCNLDTSAQVTGNWLAFIILTHKAVYLTFLPQCQSSILTFLWLKTLTIWSEQIYFILYILWGKRPYLPFQVKKYSIFNLFFKCKDCFWSFLIKQILLPLTLWGLHAFIKTSPRTSHQAPRTQL